MKLRDLLKNIDVLACNADLDMEISGISYDSRKTRPGDLFVAVKGLQTDGHRFIPKAMELGLLRCSVRIFLSLAFLMFRFPTAVAASLLPAGSFMGIPPPK